MPGKTLVVLGSGPGIGVAVACNFSVRGFTHIALVSRDAERLKKDKDLVLDAIQERGYSCQVKAWSCDLTKFDELKKTLDEVQGYGSLECVLFNAARVAGKPPLDEDIENIEQDFRVRGPPLTSYIYVLTTVLFLVDQSCIVQSSTVGDAFAGGSRP